MDTQIVRALKTDGKGSFFEGNYTIPELKPTEILVKSVFTGICTSDIDMMQGKFPLLAEHQMGHEGLAEVVAIGDKVINAQVGNYVATRGEPAYADMYVVKHKEYIVVPEADPKWILEPVACGVNAIQQNITRLTELSGNQQRCAILGSGFVAHSAYNYMRVCGLQFEYEFIGSHNPEVWTNQRSELQGKYDVIVDFTLKMEVFGDYYNPNALLILGANKQGYVDFGPLLWNSVSISTPSPRAKTFYPSMLAALKLVRDNDVNASHFWTQGYAREDFEQAFAASVNRKTNYNRGYIKWL
jgi:hypothetical protein